MSGKVGRVSMTDVARRAGVSQSTVSYVLSGSRPISPEVREQVERAVRELNYTPRAAAQALRGDRTHTIALSIPSGEAVIEAVVGLYVLEIADACRRAGFDLLMVTDSERPAKALRTVLASGRADGAILMQVIGDDERIKVALELGAPVVAMGEPWPPSDLPFVDYDFRRAARMAVEEVASRGHHRICLIGATDEEYQGEYLYVERAERGFLEACAELGITGTVVRASRDRRILLHRVRAALEGDPEISALVIQSLIHFDAMRGEFARVHPDASEDSVLALGTTGHPSERASDAPRIENSIKHITHRAVDLVLDRVNGLDVVSERIRPTFMPAR